MPISKLRKSCGISFDSGFCFLGLPLPLGVFFFSPSLSCFCSSEFFLFTFFGFSGAWQAGQLVQLLCGLIVFSFRFLLLSCERSLSLLVGDALAKDLGVLVLSTGLL